MNSRTLFITLSIALFLALCGSIFFTTKSFNKTAQTNKSSTQSRTLSLPTGVVVNEFKPSKPREEWNTYINKKFNYTIAYPAEFIVNNTPTNGAVEDAVTFSFRLNEEAITTVAQVQILNQKYDDIKEKTKHITDKNGNQIVYYYLPYTQSKTLFFIGIAYPGEVSGFTFNSIVDEMKSSINIKKL